MFYILDKVGYTFYYKNNIPEIKSNISEICVQSSTDMMAITGFGVNPNNLKQNVLKYIGIVSSFTICVLTIAAGFKSNASIAHYVKVSQTLSVVTQILPHILQMHFCKIDVLHLRQEIAHLWRIEDLPEEERANYQRIYLMQSRIFQVFSILVAITLLMYHIKPFFGSMPFYSWTYDDSRLSFWFTSILGLIFVDSIALMGIGVDFAFISICVNIMIQFKLLQSRIVSLDYDRCSEEVNNDLDELIRYHDFLLRYVKHVDKTFTIFFLAQYCMTVSGSCIYMIVLTFAENMDIVQYTELLISMGIFAFQFTLFCLTLTEITTQVNLVGEVLFHSQWYNNNRNDGRYKTKIYFMLMRCHKGCDFTAGGMARMDREAMIKVFKLVVSIWTLARTLKK